jgi:phage terminase large subunit
VIEVPEILNIPRKLLPLITDLDEYRYFLIEGGRASGKSQTIARLIAYLCEQKPLRIVCGRETQNSIEESVYTIFADLIRVFNLNFDVSATKIDHRVTGSAIRFRGFREQGATNIKGLEGVDILWVDESQAISKQTLDVIIPTVRKNNSKIIWSMNRMLENDPVYVAMAGRPDCLHIHIDYNENPFCPEAMKKEALTCKAYNEDDYKYIWLGQPLKKGDDALYTTDEVYGSPKLEYLNPGVRKRVMGVDVARYGEDETVFSIIESYNASQWHHIWQDSWKDKSTMETVGRIVELTRTWNLDQVVIDDTGVGGGVTDRLGELRIPAIPFVGASKAVNELYLNKRSEAFFRLKEMFNLRTMKILRDVALQSQLLSIRYKYMSSGKKGLVDKDEMRKAGIKSPDRADALAMAVYYKDDSLNERDYEDRKQPADYAMTEGL